MTKYKKASKMANFGRKTRKKEGEDEEES